MSRIGNIASRLIKWTLLMLVTLMLVLGCLNLYTFVIKPTVSGLPWEPAPTVRKAAIWVPGLLDVRMYVHTRGPRSWAIQDVRNRALGESLMFDNPPVADGAGSRLSLFTTVDGLNHAVMHLTASPDNLPTLMSPLTTLSDLTFLEPDQLDAVGWREVPEMSGTVELKLIFKEPQVVTTLIDQLYRGRVGADTPGRRALVNHVLADKGWQLTPDDSYILYIPQGHVANGTAQQVLSLYQEPPDEADRSYRWYTPEDLKQALHKESHNE